MLLQEVDVEVGTVSAPQEDPRPDGLRQAPSLVVLATGNGKGKSSSAFGMMLRALAQDWPVAVVQFVKSGDWRTGEEVMARRLGVDWRSVGEGFTWDSKDLARDAARARAGWAVAAAIIAAGRHRLVILDEITYLISWGWLDVSAVVEAIRGRPTDVNVILTGRDAHHELIDLADTVSEVVERKHAYRSGIAAKRGIDL